ncbi:uncharacterized protein LOC131660355 isoform X2 [Vicia villosa]|uniref:uncharacterized protein LOC131660355 isoform X2 n=1 Tax=Vicia villosa TaxID=3911 RepID=UPI00273C4AA7|nr:uncharacterized protein LOC131660355 isoform X2 [Vicia villosa]
MPIQSVPEPTQTHFMDHEIQAMERQIVAIRTVKEVKTKHLLEDLRLLCSSFTEEQLQKPVLEIFQQILPNLSIVNHKESNKCQVTWKDKAPMSMSINYDDVHTSLLQRLSMAYPHCPSSVPHSTGITIFVQHDKHSGMNDSASRHLPKSKRVV